MKLKRVMAGALSLSVVAAGFCGCKNNSVASDDSLTYWVSFNGSNVGVESFGDLPPIQKMMEDTEVKIKFIHPVSGMENEQFNVMIASGDYPDIISYDFGRYSGGPEAAIKDKVIISLNDVINEYSPNFKKYMDSNKEIRKQTVTDSGEYYTYPCIFGDQYLQVYMGIIVRKDIMNKLNFKAPETIDEWTAYLKACKNSGIESPLIMTLSQAYMFMQAYGVKNGLYVENGKVKYGEIEPGFKKAIQLLADWYKAGYIDRDFATVNNTDIKTAMISGKSVVAVGATGGGIGEWQNAVSKDDGFEFAAVKNPVINKGDIPFYGHWVNPVQTMYGTSISTACKDVKAAAKVLDYGYSEEGKMTYNFGILGESYEMVDGYPTYTEKVTKDASGRSMSSMITYYACPNGVGPYIKDRRYMEQMAALPTQKESIEIWGETDAKKHILPPVSLNSEETGKTVSIASNMNSYIEAELLKFITGVRSMDEFDSFVNKLKEMNIEQYINCYQSAYDRYMNR